MRTPAELIAEAKAADQKLRDHARSLAWLTPVEEVELNEPVVSEEVVATEASGEVLDEPAYDELTSQPIEDVPVVGQGQTPVDVETEPDALIETELTDIEEDNPVGQTDTDSGDTDSNELSVSPLSEPDDSDVSSPELEDSPVVAERSLGLETEVNQEVRAVENQDFEDSETDNPVGQTEDISDETMLSTAAKTESDQYVSEDSPVETSAPVEEDFDESVTESQPESSEEEPPELSSPDQVPMSVEEVRRTELSEIPVTSLASVEFDDSLDPSREFKDSADRQIEFAMKMNDDFAEQLSRELGPQFQELRDHQTQTTHDYVNSQLMMSTWLRDKG